MTETLPLTSHRSRILVLSTSFVVASRLRMSIAREADYECLCVTTVVRAREALEDGRIVGLVLEAEDARGHPAAPLAHRARDGNVRRPVIALLRRSEGWTASALALIAEHPALIALIEEFDPVAVLRAITGDRPTAQLLADTWPHLSAAVPAALHPVVRLALARADAPLPVPELARALGVHRKTLWQRCRRAGVPSPQVLLMWCRLVAASHALRTRGESVERIANQMEFASPTALRNATRRYLGVTPSELRDTGGEVVACRAFGAWLRARRDVTAGDAA